MDGNEVSGSGDVQKGEQKVRAGRAGSEMTEM